MHLAIGSFPLHRTRAQEVEALKEHPYLSDLAQLDELEWRVLRFALHSLHNAPDVFELEKHYGLPPVVPIDPLAPTFPLDQYAFWYSTHLSMNTRVTGRELIQITLKCLKEWRCMWTAPLYRPMCLILDTIPWGVPSSYAYDQGVAALARALDRQESLYTVQTGRQEEHYLLTRHFCAWVRQYAGERGKTYLSPEYFMWNDLPTYLIIQPYQPHALHVGVKVQVRFLFVEETQEDVDMIFDLLTMSQSQQPATLPQIQSAHFQSYHFPVQEWLGRDVTSIVKDYVSLSGSAAYLVQPE